MLRQDTTCQNCGYQVDKRYCSNCGQENVELHRSLQQLFSEFIEYTFYIDSSFWETFRNLLLNPGKLTRDYLTGKRKRYINPIKLYFLFSFAATLILSFLPDFSEQGRASVLHYFKGLEEKINSYSSVAELDSSEQSLPPNQRMSAIEYYITKDVLMSKQKGKRSLEDMTVEAMVARFPQVLFVYMPTFALLLWLFQNKKRWWLYDSSIFTLHFFSSLLLYLTIYGMINSLLSVSAGTACSIFRTVNFTVLIICPTIYFYKGYKRMYRESVRVSFKKSTALLLINALLIPLTLIGYTLLTY